MIGSQYIPVVNADNYNVPLIHDAQVVVTSLTLTKNLVSQDIAIAKIFGIALSKYLDAVDSSILDNYLIEGNVFNSSEFFVSDILMKHKLELEHIIAATIAKIYGILLSKILTLIDESSFNSFLIDSEIITFLDSYSFDNYLSNDKILTSSKFLTLGNQFYLSKFLTLSDIISLTSSQTLSFSKLLELTEVFELIASQTLELSKVLSLSKIFSLGKIQTLLVSDILNITDTIKLDYLYYLIDGLSLEETIDIIATYLGVPVKCITTTLSKMNLATTLTKLGLESTARVIGLDTEIDSKCD